MSNWRIRLTAGIGVNRGPIFSGYVTSHLHHHMRLALMITQEKKTLEVSMRLAQRVSS
jgi:hypothetical protein